jgi:hypothetical protein
MKGFDTMKILLYLLAFTLSLLASTTDSCQKCHPTIVSEFQTSLHKNSSTAQDKVHKAVWEKHPLQKKNKYNCAKCHAPTKAQANTHEGITCVTCHSIKSVQAGTKSNTNIYEKEKKTFYSAQNGRENEKVSYQKVSTWWGDTYTVGSAYHDIDYTKEIFYTGKVCMGCHSHKKNSHKLNVCITEKEGAASKEENCITCHMPKIKGTATTVRISDKHSFHGFAGVVTKPKMLSKYVTLAFHKTTKGFDVVVNNTAPHKLLTHPLRVVQLKTSIIRDKQKIQLQTFTFQRVIGKDSKASMPWLATEVVKDTMIQANEKRTISFKEKVMSGDKIEVTLGFYRVNPQALKDLGLQEDKELQKFTLLKTQYFKVK